jgi:hypothetical protein
MGFDPCNCSLKIWESIGTPTPKVGTHLGVWGFIPSLSLTLSRAWNVTPGIHTWPASSQAFILVASLRLRLWHQWWWCDYVIIKEWTVIVIEPIHCKKYLYSCLFIFLYGNYIIEHLDIFNILPCNV